MEEALILILKVKTLVDQETILTWAVVALQEEIQEDRVTQVDQVDKAFQVAREDQVAWVPDP
jgi:hypothetical protein